MLIMKKILIFLNFLLLIGIHQSSFSQEASSSLVDLTCKGESGGTDIRSEYREFDITVNTVTGAMFNYPGRVSQGCIMSLKISSRSCSVASNYIQCICKTGEPYFAQGGSMLLSRNTGNLKITTYFKDAIWEGNYSCEKVSTRRF
jgi:hypothetical protein